jgi:glycosyltransferase involved in cell wall biosynthesis
MKVALSHDWLTGMRGGEYVLEAISEMFPAAELFTLISIPGKVSARLEAIPTHVSWLRWIPGAEKKYRTLLPLMPAAMASLNLDGFDLIVSSSHCVAKGIRKRKDAVHVSYVHAPMRYMWARFDEYFGPGQAPVHIRLAAHLCRPFLQSWDRRVSDRRRVDQLVANSTYIARQIHDAYQREPRVVHPFVDISRFGAARRPGSKYLIVGAFAPYKRIDLAIEAFNRLRLPLQIVGSGQDEKKLRAIAGPTIEFLGALSNEEIAALYSTCKAFVFPGAEDFGITPLEAMCAGAPVIAFAEGGAMETVTERTGVFFAPQTVESLTEAILKIEQGTVVIHESDCRARAAMFSRGRFQKELAAVVRQAWTAAGKDISDLESVMCAHDPSQRLDSRAAAQRTLDGDDHRVRDDEPA